MFLPSSPVSLYVGDFPSWGQRKWPLKTNIAHLVGIYQQSNQLSKDIRTASNNMGENCRPRDRDRSKGFFAALRVSFTKAREDWVELSKNRASLFSRPTSLVRKKSIQKNVIHFRHHSSIHVLVIIKEAFGSSWKVMKSTNAYYNHIVISLYWIRILETLIAQKSKWPNMTDSPKRVLEY